MYPINLWGAAALGRKNARPFSSGIPVGSINESPTIWMQTDVACMRRGRVMRDS